jgi:hypothetical protein
MSQYTFTFKKDDIFVEFTTTDKEIVEQQFQIWVADADDYARGHNQGKGKREKGKEEIGNRKLEIGAVSRSETEANPPTFQPSNPQENASRLTSHVSPDSTLQPSNPPLEEQPEVFDKASSLLKTINTIQDEAKNEATEEKQPVETQIFEEVLEKTIENPTFEPVKTQDKVFLNFINSKNTTDKFHYLIITAYYLSEFEKQERFSLKQINAKLMQNLSEAIDQVTLQEAINQNFIELVPDLTETSDVAEYRLTRAGEDFFATKI